jgi:hypothetical protein
VLDHRRDEGIGRRRALAHMLELGNLMRPQADSNSFSCPNCSITLDKTFVQLALLAFHICREQHVVRLQLLQS